MKNIRVSEYQNPNAVQKAEFMRLSLEDDFKIERVARSSKHLDKLLKDPKIRETIRNVFCVVGCQKVAAFDTLYQVFENILINEAQKCGEAGFHNISIMPEEALEAIERDRLL